jgi:hypothetical protein
MAAILHYTWGAFFRLRKIDLVLPDVIVLRAYVALIEHAQKHALPLKLNVLNLFSN